VAPVFTDDAVLTEEAVMKVAALLTIPCMAVLVTAGCSSGRVARLEESLQSQQQYSKEMMSIVDRNANTIKETAGQVAALEKRIAALESNVTTSSSGENASIQEMKENLSFLSDQLARIDKSIQTARPQEAVRPPQGASVFKPGGFDLKSSYDAALEDYKARKFETAISGFKEVLTVAPTSDYADNAQYWIGECYDSMGNYDQALAAFAKVYAFTKSNKLADAHVKTALILQKTGKKDQAREEFRTVVSGFPGTNAASIAQAQLGKLGQ
jgi:tol-pal system protein YbgF